jgi:hypothetical protein
MGYWKMDRYCFDTTPGMMHGKEIYVNFNGESFSGSAIQIIGPDGTWRNLIATSQIRDSQWHCHELRLRLNDEGQANARITYWLDGTQVKDYSGLAWGAAAGDAFNQVAHFPLGNTGARHRDNPPCYFQNEWRAMEFDDYVLSTTYVGPEGQTQAQKLFSPLCSKGGNADVVSDLCGGVQIGYSLEHPAQVRMEICDHQGKVVRILENRPKPAGFHRMSWDGKDEHGRMVPNGVYLYRLLKGNRITIARVMRFH